MPEGGRAALDSYLTALCRLEEGDVERLELAETLDRLSQGRRSD